MSRLKLRKKKYHPPLQEPPTQQNVDCHKTTEDLDKKMKTNEDQLKKDKIKKNMACSSNKIKTTEDQKNTYKQSYAQIASSSIQNNEESEIFRRAIESAKKHKIKMKAGRKDRGYGNCAFEAAINNINDRACYSNKLLLSANWYRRIWMDQMMENIILGICPWNLSYTEQEIRHGFEKLKESGIYEIDFFGDMMMGGGLTQVKTAP